MKTLKKGCKVLMLVLAMLVVLGCKDAYAYASSTETVIKMGEDEKAGTLETKIGLAKNYHKNLKNSSVESVKVFADLLEYCVNDELGLDFELNTTDSSVDYITVIMKFNDIDDLNRKLHAINKEDRKIRKLVDKQTVLYAIYNACFESKDYGEELAKLIQKDGFVCDADDEWLKMLTYRMLTGQNVNNMEDIKVSQDDILSVDFSEVNVDENTGLGLEKTEYGYTIHAGIINMITSYIETILEYNAYMFYNLSESESKLYTEFDKVVYEQFVDTYYNDINLPYVMESCFPGVIDIAQIDSELLLSKLEISESKQVDSIYDMYAHKVNIDEIYKAPKKLIGTSKETSYEDFKLCIGDVVYYHKGFYDLENASDSLILKEESAYLTDGSKEDIKELNNNVDYDNTPDTADGIDLYILAGIALLATAGIAMALVINKRKMYV